MNEVDRTLERIRINYEVYLPKFYELYSLVARGDLSFNLERIRRFFLKYRKQMSEDEAHYLSITRKRSPYYDDFRKFADELEEKIDLEIQWRMPCAVE